MNSCQLRTHGPMKRSLYVQFTHRANKSASFNFWFHKNFHKRLFQERPRLVTFNLSYYFIARVVVPFLVNILKFPPFYRVPEHGSCQQMSGETGLLCDETDVMCLYVFRTIPAIYINLVPTKINRLNFVNKNQCFLWGRISELSINKLSPSVCLYLSVP